MMNTSRLLFKIKIYSIFNNLNKFMRLNIKRIRYFKYRINSRTSKTSFYFTIMSSIQSC